MTDHVLAGERWRFDAEVTSVFDDMLSRSIPGYDEMRAVVSEVGERFMSEPGRVIDLGAARGEAVARILERHPSAHALAVEISEPMAEAARARLSSYPQAAVRRLDLRHDYPAIVEVDLVLCVLTLQFVPVEHRFRVLADAHRSLRRGGALILVEKILGGSELTERLLVEVYLERKRALGYSDDEIDRKRLSLEGVLVPLPAVTNETLLSAVGFSPVERIWQSLNFAGWLAVRT